MKPVYQSNVVFSWFTVNILESLITDAFHEVISKINCTGS
jgi:hypothetical protein